MDKIFRSFTQTLKMWCRGEISRDDLLEGLLLFNCAVEHCCPPNGRVGKEAAGFCKPVEELPKVYSHLLDLSVFSSEDQYKLREFTELVYLARREGRLYLCCRF